MYWIFSSIFIKEWFYQYFLSLIPLLHGICLVYLCIYHSLGNLILSVKYFVDSKFNKKFYMIFLQWIIQTKGREYVSVNWSERFLSWSISTIVMIFWSQIFLFQCLLFLNSLYNNWYRSYLMKNMTKNIQ